MHVHSSSKHYNSRCVSFAWMCIPSREDGSNGCYLTGSHITLLTHLIQSPELNSSNPSPVLKDVEQRILRCYFRDLCLVYLS